MTGVARRKLLGLGPCGEAGLCAAEALTAAADLLERDGWRQGEGDPGRGPRCATQAVAEAIGGRGVEGVGVYYRALEILRPDGFVAWWNDEPGRTQAEVIAALREAAAS